GAGLPAHLIERARGAEKSVDPRRPGRHVTGGYEFDPLSAGGDLLRAVLAFTPERRHPAGHRLDVGHPERLVHARHHEQRRVLGGGPGLDWWQLTAQLD